MQAFSDAGIYARVPGYVRKWYVDLGAPVRAGQLMADMDGRGNVPLIGISNTAFSGLYGLGVEFIPGGPGGLFVKHVSGDYRFARKK